MISIYESALLSQPFEILKSTLLQNVQIQISSLINCTSVMLVHDAWNQCLQLLQEILFSDAF